MEKGTKRLVVGVLAHVDSGKTTLSEAMLYRAGAIRKLGRVDHRDAFLDTDSLERARGITIFSKQALFTAGNARIAWLDTPGHVDFSAEAERTVQVLDYAVLVISGPDGVQSHTETLWSLLRRCRVPTFLFVNKMDLPGPGRDALLEQLRRRLGEGFVDFSAPEEERNEQAVQLSERFIASLPELRHVLATDAEATYNGDPAAQNLGEVIFCYPGFRAICNYRIAHQLFLEGVPYIPRIITELAHSETGIDIHPGARIGHHFSIDHGTGTVIGETSILGNYVRIFQGVSLAGEKFPPDENGNAIRGVARHPVVGNHVTIYSNATLLGHIHIGDGATIYGNVWLTHDVAAGESIGQSQNTRQKYNTK